MKPSSPPEIAQSRPQRVTGLACIFGCIICWGTIPVILRHLSGEISSWTANGFRYPLAAVLYWPFLIRGWKRGSVNQKLLRHAAIPMTLSFLGQNLWALCPYYLPASAIGFFIRTSLVWSLIAAAAWFPDERRIILNRRFLQGTLLSIIGCVMISWPDPAGKVPITASGVCLVLLASVFFGLYGVSVRAFLVSHDPLEGFGIVAQGVAAGTFLLMLLLGDPGKIPRLPTDQLIMLIMSSLLGIAFGHFFLYSAIRLVGAALSSALQTITPLMTAGLAMLFLGERLTMVGWIGAGMVLSGGAMLLVIQTSPQGNIRNSDPLDSDC